MELASDAVTFSFYSCKECGSDNALEKAKDIVNVNIHDILNSGIPICSECGTDLELLDTCMTNIDGRNNHLTMDQSRALAEELVDGYDMEGVIDTCVDATELWINAQSINELKECVDAEIWLQNENE